MVWNKPVLNFKFPANACFNPSFLMEWSGIGEIELPKFPFYRFNPSFLMEWSGIIIFIN